MSTPRHRLLLVTSLLLAANPAARASNPIGSTGSVPCATCAKACPLCGDSTSWTQSAIASFDWEILVGLARYPKPTTYSDLAQAAYEKDGNLPTFDQMLGRYFPNSPLQQSQTPLKISQSQISDATFHPSCLFLDSEANIEAVLKKSDAGGEYIHQILTDDAFTLIEPVAATSTPAAGSGWRVRVWKRNAGTLTEKDGDGFYITTSFEAATNTPLKDVTFRHIAGTEIDSNTLTLIHTETENTGTSPRIITQEIVQTVGTGTDANGANGSGKPKKVTSRLFYGDGVGGDHLSTEILDYSAYGAKVWDYTITRSVFTAPMLAGGAIGTLDDTTDTSSDLTSKTVETYQDFSDTAITGGGAMGMKRLVSISRSGELTSYTYVAADPTDPNSGASHGRLKTVTRPDGSWTSYTYSGMGTAPFITEYSSWLDSTSADLGNARKTETSVSGNIFTVRTFIAGQLIAKSQTTLAVGGSMADTLVTTLQWDGTDSPPVGGDMTLSSGNSLTTTTAYFSDAARTSPGRVHWIEHPDGTATTYAYGPDSGNLTTTICTGAGDRGGVTAGTQVDTTYGLGNIPIAESTKDLASDYSIESWITEPATYDPIGRPITRVYNGDTADYDTSIYSCCGLSEFRARDGSTTHYYRDKLKRVYSTTITADSVAGCPVVATNTIISGLTTSQTRSVTLMGPDADSDGKLLPHPSNPVFLGSNTSSLDGLTTTTISPSRSSTDSADRLITRVVTTHNPATGDSETETYQVGAAWIDLAATTTNSTTTHFLDGRTHAVTGDAVTNVTYAYDKHSLKGGGLVTKATVSGLTTSSDTYTDPLGRTLQTVTPAAGTTTYTYNSADFDAGARGKLASVADADCTGTETSVSYGYNTKGERTTTKRTVPTGATPAPTQSTVTATTFINDEVYGYGHCRSTTTTVNDTIVSQSLSVIDTASGFISIISTPTGTSKTVTTRPGATTGAATSTSTRPDGTKTVTTSTHGLTIEVKSQTAPASTISTTTYDYDSLQRLQYVTDSRTGTDGRTEYHEFTESGTPLVTKRAGRTTTNTCDALGRVIQSVLPDNSATHTSYYPTGLVKAQWGSQTYPTLRVYNGQGQLTTLYTYQALTGEPVNATGAAATTWNYSPTTGQLLSKHDATGLGPSYTYTVAGRLKTRTWARGVHTRYDYLYGFHVATRYFTNATADTEINDGNDTDTPDVNTTFDILGRQLAITQTAIKMLGNGPTYPVRSQIEYSYADGTGGDHGISSETISYDFNLDGSFELTRVLDRADRSFGRDMGFTLGTAENHASDQSVSYGYNNAGNVNGVTGAGKVFTYGYAYAQAAGAPRVGVAADPEGAINDFKPYALAAPKHTVIRTYEATRDVLVSIDNKIGTSVSYYIYGVNNLGQRETLNTTGPAFSGLAPNHNWAWQYDALGQITTATCGWDSDLSRTYTFDDIGNRLTATTDSGEDAATTTYTPNSLNQYISINPGTAVTPAYDNDGNLYTDAAVNAIGLGLKFKWDGENRLTAVCKDDEGSTLLASYAYDPIGRRIRKTITSESIREQHFLELTELFDMNSTLHNAHFL